MRNSNDDIARTAHGDGLQYVDRPTKCSPRPPYVCVANADDILALAGALAGQYIPVVVQPHHEETKT